MKSEQTRKVSDGVELSSAEATGNESKEDREKSFSRRALLQWSLPAAVAGLAALSPSQANADPYQHNDVNHVDFHGDYYYDIPHADHEDDLSHDDAPHGDGGPHEDGHGDSPSYYDHEDHDDHLDAHDDYTDNHDDHLDSSHEDYSDHEDHYDS